MSVMGWVGVVALFIGVSLIVWLVASLAQSKTDPQQVRWNEAIMYGTTFRSMMLQAKEIESLLSLLPETQATVMPHCRRLLDLAANVRMAMNDYGTQVWDPPRHSGQHGHWTFSVECKDPAFVRLTDRLMELHATMGRLHGLTTDLIGETGNLSYNQAKAALGDASRDGRIKAEAMAELDALTNTQSFDERLQQALAPLDPGPLAGGPAAIQESKT